MEMEAEMTEEQSLEKFEAENRALITSQNIDKSVVDICHKHKYELMKCVNCPIVKECNYTKKRISKLREKAEEIAKEIYETEIEMDNSAENQVFAEKKMEAAYEDYLKRHASKELQNERCIYERKELMTVLQRFVDADYDITDPRSFIIINELIGTILNSGRMSKAFTQYGLMMQKESAGGTTFYANPLLKVKSDYSKSIIETVEALDRILKSDETQKADKEFTSYLMQSLRIKDAKKVKVYDSFDIPIEEEKDDPDEVVDVEFATDLQEGLDKYTEDGDL